MSIGKGRLPPCSVRTGPELPKGQPDLPTRDDAELALLDTSLSGRAAGTVACREVNASYEQAVRAQP